MQKCSYIPYRAGGGISNNDFVMQLIADLTRKSVVCMPCPDMSAIGIALMAGLQSGKSNNLFAWQKECIVTNITNYSTKTLANMIYFKQIIFKVSSNTLLGDIVIVQKGFCESSQYFVKSNDSENLSTAGYSSQIKINVQTLIINSNHHTRMKKFWWSKANNTLGIIILSHCMIYATYFFYQILLHCVSVSSSTILQNRVWSWHAKFGWCFCWNNFVLWTTINWICYCI